MLRLFILTLALQASAASVTEADFAAGYWDQDFGAYGGRAMTVYTLSVAVENPAAARTAVEAALSAAGGKLTAFSDQSQAAYGGNEYSQAMRARPIYTIGYQFQGGKAGAVARRLITNGRLIAYSVQAPYQASQRKEIEDRIEWIEKEKLRGGEALKSMPVARAMLESKLKKLKAALEMAKSSDGLESVSVTILREDASGAPKPAPAQP